MKTKTILTPFFLCLILGINSTTFSMGLLAKLVCGLANKQEGTSLNSNFNSTNMCPIPDDKSPHYKDIEENFGKNVADSITTQPDFLQEDFELESQDEDKDLTWYCYSLANITEKEASILAES
ncbi:hypothetical protein KAH94_00130, partial [bacterium]|nr:hypothetical protein [bacterium]